MTSTLLRKRVAGKILSIRSTRKLFCSLLNRLLKIKLRRRINLTWCMVMQVEMKRQKNKSKQNKISKQWLCNWCHKEVMMMKKRASRTRRSIKVREVERKVKVVSNSLMMRKKRKRHQHKMRQKLTMKRKKKKWKHQKRKLHIH